MGTPLSAPLVSVAELGELLDTGEPRPSVLDVRWDLAAGPRRDLYEQGHVPGAAFADLDADLAGEPGAAGRHPLPTGSDFEAAMRALGVDRERDVVVYDAGTSTAAARAWWLLRYFGHRSVMVLDGGLAAWADAGMELETGSWGGGTGDFTARPGGMAVLDAAAAGALARRGVLLDARAPERFRGESEPIDPVAGHIPGAANRPTTLNVERSGRFLQPVTLRAAFARLGIDGSSDVGAYCGSGVTAAHEVLALELAGYGAALYPGSWSEWIADAERPVATGP
jgi:thiosulfate/3-mercaptopyruvate sulfurtransferase